jgi:uncharacterized protein
MLTDFKGGSFSDGGLLVTMVIEVVCATAALYFLQSRNYAVSTLYPEPKIKDAGIGIALYIIFYIVHWIFIAPLYSSQPVQPIQQMLSKATVTLEVVVPLAVVNGAYEEVFLLGFLLRGLRSYGASTAVGISLLVRVLYHLYQGPVGALTILIYGALLSVYYVRFGKLFPVVFCHILSDIIPFL